MKKLFTLCIALLFSCVAMNAQNFIFVDENDNVIENGATLTMNETSLKIDFDWLPDGTFGPVEKLIVPLKNVLIKNVSNSTLECSVTFTIDELPDGTSFNACCSGNCAPILEGVPMVKTGIAAPGKYIYICGEDELGKVQETEWFPSEAAGSCTLKLSIQGEKSMLPDSEITINFIYDGATGIDGIQNNADNKVVARYSINGQLLDAPQKGINILKYADGRIEKVIVK